MIPFSSEKGRTMNMILTLLSLTEVFSQDHSGQLKGRIADASSKARVGEYIGLPCQTFSEVKQLSKEFSVYWSYCNAMKCYGENIKWSWIIGMTCKGITRVNDKGPYASRTILFSNGTLEILNVKPSDETVYSCTVYSENYRSSRSSFYSLKTVSGGVPEPVVIVNAEVDDKKVTLSWKEPEQNGADITQYTIYKRISSDKKWINVGEIKDISNRVFVVQVENTKKHEFVVTATNKYGESLVSKENIKIEEMPYSAATPSSLESQKGFYPVLQIFYILFVFLVIIIIVLSVVVWKIRRRQCPRCGEVRPVDPVSLQVEDNIGPPSDLNTKESANYATPSAGSGYYMPLHLSGRSWEVSREDVYVIKIIGKGAFSQVAQATVKNVQEHQEETTVAVKMLKVNAPPSDRKDLLSELELMKKLKPHPHVIKLIGCVTESEPLMVLIEYVPCGDLLGYLRKSRGLNDTYYINPDVQPETNLTSEQLIKFAWQVADGMCYLSSKKDTV